jgi:hypothetical protein
MHKIWWKLYIAFLWRLLSEYSSCGGVLKISFPPLLGQVNHS